MFCHQGLHTDLVHCVTCLLFSLQAAWSLITWRSPLPTPWPATSQRSPPSCCLSWSTFLCHWEPSPSCVLTWELTWWEITEYTLSVTKNMLTHSHPWIKLLSIWWVTQYLNVKSSHFFSSRRFQLSPWLMKQLRATSWSVSPGTHSGTSWWMRGLSALPMDKLVGELKTGIADPGC